MWHFRSRPEALTDEQREELEALFGAVPQLRELYAIRVRFAEIFDTATSRRQALRELVGLFLRMLDSFPELEGFICTFEAWQEEILNYFDARQTSGPVEGINNKARVIIKRSYGLKSGDSLWTRLVLDLNRAKDSVKYTLEQIHQLVSGFRDLFAPACT
jgi:transposase